MGDITKLKVDAIVNAANHSLLGGGGVDGAIHTAAGKELLTACRLLGSCETGQAKLTLGFDLPASFIIHTVGPIFYQYSFDDARQLLEKAYKNSLLLTLDHPIKSIAFPNISTGVYAFPKKEAAMIVIKTIEDFLIEHHHLEEIIFCCYDEENYHIYQTLLESE